MVFVMNRENLRKVSYYTEDPNQGFDPERETPQNKLGYFHAWGVTPWKSPYDNSYYNRAVAVIEEENGYMIEIPSEWFKFES
jgi:hypothetical protein